MASYKLKGFRSSTPPQEARNSTTNSQPWAPAQPYLLDSMGRATQLYAQGGPKYTPWSQVANLDPMQIQAGQGINAYVNSAGTQATMRGAQQGVQGLLSGTPNAAQGVAGQGMGNVMGLISNNNLLNPAQATNSLAYGNIQNPYLENSVNQMLQDKSNNFQMNTLQGLRHQAIGDGSYGSSRNELTEGAAAGAVSKDMRDTSAQMYGNDYQNQQNLQLGALGQNANQQLQKAQMTSGLFDQGAQQNLQAKGIGLQNYNTTLNMPLSMIDAQNSVGQVQQQQNQNVINDQTNRWNFGQKSPWDNFSNYQNLLTNFSRYGGSDSKASSSTTSAPQTSNAANITGGLLSAAGLAAKIYSGK